MHSVGLAADLSAKERAVAKRYEAKYFLNEVEAELVRDFISAYTEPDRAHPEYFVTSIYLDSPTNLLYQGSDHGENNRFKLRVRGYDGDETGPLFVEVKQRFGGVVRKRRATLRREHLGSLHWSELPGVEGLVNPGSARDRENLLLFTELAQAYQAEPRVCVGYRRAAFVSVFDEPVRATFDDQISFAAVPENPVDLWSRPTRWHLLDDLPTVLEIKFTDSFPFWVRKLVQRFELKRGSLAKYVACVSRMDREWGRSAPGVLY